MNTEKSNHNIGRNMPPAYIVTTVQDNYAIVRLNRPEVLNAINMKLMEELVETLEKLDKDDASAWGHT